MEHMPTQMPTPVRQTSTASFTGVVCKAAGEDFIVKADEDTGILNYVDPDSGSIDASQGGIFRFAETADIKEIRGVAGTITVFVQDRDGSHEVPITSGVFDSNQIVFPALGLILAKSQQLVVKSTIAGWIEVYAVKGDWV